MLSRGYESQRHQISTHYVQYSPATKSRRRHRQTASRLLLRHKLRHFVRRAFCSLTRCYASTPTVAISSVRRSQRTVSAPVMWIHKIRVRYQSAIRQPFSVSHCPRIIRSWYPGPRFWVVAFDRVMMTLASIDPLRPSSRYQNVTVYCFIKVLCCWNLPAY